MPLERWLDLAKLRADLIAKAASVPGRNSTSVLFSQNFGVLVEQICCLLTAATEGVASARLSEQTRAITAQDEKTSSVDAQRPCGEKP